MPSTTTENCSTSVPFGAPRPERPAVTTQAAASLADEHSVLLWETCAYADDLTEAARSGREVAPAFDAMLEFLHDRLLPYLAGEERQLSAEALRDKHLHDVLLADHERLRADVDKIECGRTRRLIALATDALVERLDRHVRREEAWVSDPLDEATEIDLRDGVDLRDGPGV